MLHENSKTKKQKCLSFCGTSSTDTLPGSEPLSGQWGTSVPKIPRLYCPVQQNYFRKALGFLIN